MSGTLTGADALHHYGVEVLAGLVRKREDERVKLLGEIKRVGMDKFAEIFTAWFKKSTRSIPKSFSLKIQISARFT